MVQNIIAVVFMVGGLFFLMISSLGLLRLPDFYSRNHAVGKSETLGSMLLLAGLAIYNGVEVNSAKLIVILLFIAMANPTAAHILANTAYISGLQPWVRLRKVTDRETGEESPGRPEIKPETREKEA